VMIPFRVSGGQEVPKSSVDHGAARKRLEKGATMLTFIWEGILSMTLAHVGPSKGLFEVVNRCVVQRHQRLREREPR
jgi:hypothetical protein